MDANDGRTPSAGGPDPTGRRQDPIGGGEYGPGALDEVTDPPTDPGRVAQETDVEDVADVRVDPQQLLDGGPTRSEGLVTPGGRPDTGASQPTDNEIRGTRKQRGRRGKVAPTTTGDATGGGMHETAEGYNIDNSSGASSGGEFDESGKLGPRGERRD